MADSRHSSREEERPTKPTVLRGTPNYIWSQNDIMGQGATGAVYKGRHKRNGDLVAIKTFNVQSQLMRSNEQTKREFAVLQKLKHKNIVQLLAIEEESQNGCEVLIMELCTHGSLYNQLDQPDNTLGLGEEDFRKLLHDVAAGMMHLREHGIVHRDIKPGNIMRYEDTEEGRYWYKLIDFGAARELDSNEEFMSLYGTEEYLHPDLYQRAVLRRPTSKRQFGVGVDLWSLGVTLFHAATGALPFKPFGGRKNRDVMYKITTVKASGVISGVQETEGGPIIWKRDLPDTCRLSRGFRALLTPILAGLMECDTRRMFTFEEFFDHVNQIQTKRVVYVFNTSAASSISIYLDNTAKLDEFQELVKAQTQILPTDQHLLCENLDLSRHWVKTDTEGKDYPTTTPSNPIFLYCDPKKVSTNAGKLQEPELPKYPQPEVQYEPEADVPLAKQCAGIIALVKRYVEETLRTQALIGKAAVMFGLHFSETIYQCDHTSSDLFQRVEETGKRVHQFCNYSKTSLSLVLAMLSELQITGIDDAMTNLQHLSTNVPEMFQSVLYNTTEIRKKLAIYFQRRSRDPQAMQEWRHLKGCAEPEACINKVDYLCRVTRRTVEEFRRDRSLKTLSYNEEQIHKFEKSKLAMNGTKAFSILQGDCLPSTKQLFYKYKQWFREMSDLKRDFIGVQQSIEKVVEILASVIESLDRNEKNVIRHITAVTDRLTELSTGSSATAAAHPGVMPPPVPTSGYMSGASSSLTAVASNNTSLASNLAPGTASSMAGTRRGELTGGYGSISAGSAGPGPPGPLHNSASYPSDSLHRSISGALSTFIVEESGFEESAAMDTRETRESLETGTQQEEDDATKELVMALLQKLRDLGKEVKNIQKAVQQHGVDLSELESLETQETLREQQTSYPNFQTEVT